MTLTLDLECPRCKRYTPHITRANRDGILGDQCDECGYPDPDFGPPQEADPDAARDALLDWKEAS
jgi:hypothetical protein